MATSVPNSLQSPEEAQLKIIDPDGDITLVIPDKRTDAERQKSDTSDGPRFLVSSKHLELASPYFKARLSQNCPGCVPDALSIILYIFHALGRQIPKRVSADTLLGVALATDYLQCHAAVEAYGQSWVETLEASIPKASPGSAIAWIMISYTFRCQEVFQAATMQAQRYGQGPFDTGGLPIPKIVKDEIDQKRNEFLDKFFALINKHEKRLQKSRIICGFRCDALHYGMLMKMLSKYEGGKDPHLRYSPNSLIRDVNRWGVLSNQFDDHSSTSQCNHRFNLLGREAYQHLSTVKKSLRGLRLPKNQS